MTNTQSIRPSYNKQKTILSAIPLLCQSLDKQDAQAHEQQMFPYARFRLFNDPTLTLDRNP